MTIPPRPFRAGPFFSYVCMVASWMFDFQSEGAGQGLNVQIFFLIAYVSCFLVFLVLDGSPNRTPPRLLPFGAVVFVFLGVSTTSGVLHGQDLYLIFRHVASLLIYLTGAYATARMVVAYSASSLRRALGRLCLCFAVSSVLIALFFGEGIDVETVRYEIQGTSSVAALGLVALALVFNVSGLELAAGLGAANVIFLTVTRVYLIVIGMQSLVLLSIFARRTILRTGLRLLMVGVVLAGLFMTLSERSLERWDERLFVSQRFGGRDPTFITRYVEWEYMWDELTASSVNLLFGSGLAAETSWWLPGDLGGGPADTGSIGFGHNQHLSLLFTGGLIGGGPLLVFQFLLGWLGIRFLRKVSRQPGEPDDVLFLGAWGATIILGALAGDCLVSTFGSRGFSLWYGIGTGLLLGARECSGPPPAVNRRP